MLAKALDLLPSARLFHDQLVLVLFFKLNVSLGGGWMNDLGFCGNGIEKERRTDRDIYPFLVAYTRLQVTLSVRRSVRWSVGWSVTECEIKPKSDLTSINAPAHPYATDAVVYTALLVILGRFQSNSAVRKNRATNRPTDGQTLI